MTRLEFIRRQRGLSQTELAKRINMNATNIVQIERKHRRAWPRLRKELSKALGIEESLLFEEDGWLKEIDIAEVK